VLRVSATVVFVLSIVLLTLMPSKPVTANVPGFGSAVIGFELATEPAHVFGILGVAGAPERPEQVRRMDLGNRIDYLFMLAYATLYAGIALLLAAHGRIGRGITALLLALAVLMFLGDAMENRQLLLLSQLTDPAVMAPPLAALGCWTHLKWYAIYAASLLVAPFIWREQGWWRWSAVPFALAALLGFTGPVYPPGIESGSYVVGVAWLMTLVRAYQRA